MAVADRQAHTIWEGSLIGGKGDTEFASSNIGRFPVTWAARTESPGRQDQPRGAARRRPRHLLRDGVLALPGPGGQRARAPARHLHRLPRAPRRAAAFAVTRSALEVSGVVAGYDQDGFQQAAEEAEKGCPISNAVRGNLEITVKATLES